MGKTFQRIFHMNTIN